VDSVGRRRYLRIDECSRAVGLGVSLWRGRGRPADVFPGLNGTHLVKSGGGDRSRRTGAGFGGRTTKRKFFDTTSRVAHCTFRRPAGVLLVPEP
jgi:hypothetical protein